MFTMYMLQWNRSIFIGRCSDESDARTIVETLFIAGDYDGYRIEYTKD